MTKSTVKKSKKHSHPLKIIRLKDIDCSSLCDAKVGKIVDEEKLAKLVALLILGHYRHVEKIFNLENNNTPKTSGGALKRAKELLKDSWVENGNSNRDGWVFQMISWISIHYSQSTPMIVSIPHPQPSFKGFDGLVLLFSEVSDDIENLIICEDKATTRPRDTITQQIWPDFKSCEDGSRDSELVAETTLLLERSGSDKIDMIIENIHWKKLKNYRIAITIDPNKKINLSKLFKGYSSIIARDNIRFRKAEVFPIDQLRDWMNSFCEKIINHLDEIEVSNV